MSKATLAAFATMLLGLFLASCSEPQAGPTPSGLSADESVQPRLTESDQQWQQFFQGVLLGFDEQSLPLELRVALLRTELRGAPQGLLASFEEARRSEKRQQDPLEAVDLLVKASDRGFGPASFVLAIMYAADAHELWEQKTQLAKRTHYLKLAHEQGFETATAVLGEAYVRAHWGVSKDAAEGRRLLLQAREKGSGYASWKLGIGYWEDWFGPSNKQKARDYLQEAGERGVGLSYGDLGILLRDQGAFADSIKAFEHGIQLSVPNVQLQLARHLFDLFPAEFQDRQRARALLVQLIDDQTSEASSAAVVLASISGKEQDLDEQLRWLRVAAANRPDTFVYSEMARVHIRLGVRAAYGKIPDNYRLYQIDAKYLQDAMACHEKGAELGGAWSMFLLGDLIMLGKAEGYLLSPFLQAPTTNSKSIHNSGTHRDREILREAAAWVCKARSVANQTGDRELYAACNEFLSFWAMACR